MTLKIFCQKWNIFCTTAYNILKTPTGVESTMLIHTIIISFNFSHVCIDCYSITLEKMVYPTGYWYKGGKSSGIFYKLLLIMKYPVNIQGNSVRDLFETGENFTRRKFFSGRNDCLYDSLILSIPKCAVQAKAYFKYQRRSWTKTSFFFVYIDYDERITSNNPLAEGRMSNQRKEKGQFHETVDHLQQSRRLPEPHL